MQIYDDQYIQQHYLMKDAIKDVSNIFHKISKNNIQIEQRTVVEVPSSSNAMLYMPCLDIEDNIGIVKVISIFPENPSKNLSTTQGQMLITELETGKHVALFEAGYLTRLRTGALSAIATDYLSRKDAITLGVIGTGGMAFEQVLGVLEVRNIQHIFLFNRTKEKAYQFKEKLKDFGINVEITVKDEVQEVVKSSDIINCATRSQQAVFDAKDLKPGTHINGVGSYKPDMREIDIPAIQKAEKIVFDDYEGVKTEAGEFIQAASDQVFDFNNIHGVLKDLVLNDASPRTNEEEITIFKSVGAAYYDLAVGTGAYQQFTH